MPLFNIILDFILNPWFILSLIFWIIVLFLVYLLRNKKEAAYLFFPLLAMFKTRKLNNIIKKISKKAPKFWKCFWTVGIFVSFSFMIFAFYFLFTNFINLIFNPRVEQAVIPLIPGVTIDLPLLFYLILPLLFIITTHEFAHGISASAEGIDIKSTGVMGAGLFFIIGFGAFVEVDERELNSTKIHRNTRLRVAAAGSYINAITLGISILLLLSFPLMISPFYRQVTQVNTVLTEAEGGFNHGSLSDGDVILAIKKKGTSDDLFITLDENQGRSLSTILNNKTSLQCSIGDNLTFRIYSPSQDEYSVKNVTLGPRYYVGMRYKYISNTELQITKIYTETEGGNNFNTNLTEGTIINEINGVSINITKGDTLEKALTRFNLKNLTLNADSETHIINVTTMGVVLGIYSNSFFMHKNEVAKFFTSLWPEFWLRELLWLFIIAFSITIFNLLPLPVFDGDRIVKELINWGFGEDFKTLKTKTDKSLFKKDVHQIQLSEYRVEKINSVKIVMENKFQSGEKNEIILAEDKYKLIDTIGDGFKDTISFLLSEQTQLEQDSLVEISYEYKYDEKQKIKRTILNVLRFITLIIFAGNFILSFIKFGGIFFWI
ncbi:MAG: site-2 protease family protein [Promethearchaeota archaeon]